MMVTTPSLANKPVVSGVMVIVKLAGGPAFITIAGAMSNRSVGTPRVASKSQLFGSGSIGAIVLK